MSFDNYLSKANAALRAEIAAKDKELARLRGAIIDAAVWFEEYAQSHAAKGDADKARRNISRATACRAALASAAPP